MNHHIPPHRIVHFTNQWWWLSNFYPVWIQYEGRLYPTLEHAYQAAKTNDIVQKARIGAATNPTKAKQLGRNVTLRPDWEEVKLQVMEDLLRIKFAVPPLRYQLLATGDAELVEGNWWGDTYWGVCKGVGENHLGKLLMKIRSELEADNLKGDRA